MASVIVFPFLFLLLVASAFAQANRNISVGVPLVAGNDLDQWRSPGDDFALGFRKLENGFYLLAIWYYKIPDNTIVWYANFGQPAPKGSTLELTVDQGLLLRDPLGDRVLWRSDIKTGEVSYAFLNDTGNFMIFDRRSEILWESFKNPTDTLLPAQILEVNGRLISRQTQTNFSQGKYVFRLLADGNAVLNTINLPSGYDYEAYYISNTFDGANSTNSGYQVVFDEDGYVYILRRNGEKVYITKPEDVVSSSIYYHKATLNFDGVFTFSYHPKMSEMANRIWTDIQVLPGNICTAIRGEMNTGPCGYNSICSLKDDRRPSCKCPPGYSFIDPENEYGGCKPDIVQICEDGAGNSSSDLYSLEPLRNTDWPMADYELYAPFTIEECKQSCLSDCLCVVAVYRGNRCWKKKLPLSNGRPDRTESSTSFLKLRRYDFSKEEFNRPFPDEKKQKNQETLVTVVSVLLGGSVLVNLVLTSFVLFSFFFIYKKKIPGLSSKNTILESHLREYSYRELREATMGFKEELGRGSCGIVFKGTTKDNGRVAVKKLDKVIEQSEKEFKTEVEAIGRTYHKNLVRLVGFCNEGQHRMLVYELMPNGTLAGFLFDDLGDKPSWSQRIHMVLGIARGLFYLHEEISPHIIHCDIKPQNILLDECYNARISDFGLAKLLNVEQSKTETFVRGTKGYVAPEWFRAGPVTAKIDVYSFGVLLLEILACRKNTSMGIDEGGVLSDWAYDCLEMGKVEDLVEGDVEAIDDRKRLERFVMVAIWCVQEDPSLRPTMKMVMLMLEGIVQVPTPPCPLPS